MKQVLHQEASSGLTSEDLSLRTRGSRVRSPPFSVLNWPWPSSGGQAPGLIGVHRAWSGPERCAWQSCQSWDWCSRRNHISVRYEGGIQLNLATKPVSMVNILNVKSWYVVHTLGSLKLATISLRSVIKCQITWTLECCFASGWSHTGQLGPMASLFGFERYSWRLSAIRASSIRSSSSLE